MQNRESSPYVLPPDQDALRGGYVTPHGTLAWYQDQAYTWEGLEEGWHALAPAPFRIGCGFATPEGVLVVGVKGDSMGFWKYEARDWAWWQSDLPFPQMTLPVGGWLLGAIPGEKGGEHALMRCTEEELRWVSSVPAPDAPVVCWVEDTSPETIGDTNTGDANSQGTLRVVGSEIGTYDIPSGSGSPSLTGRQEVETTRRRPSGHFKIDSSYPPQVVGNALFVHYQRRGSIRIDLEKGAVNPLGVAPISKSSVLWKALEKEEPKVVARIVDTIDALPPTSLLRERAGVPTQVLDVHLEPDGTVRTVLTRKGILPEPEVPAAPSTSAREESSSGEMREKANGFRASQHATESWGLWLGRHSAEVNLYHALCTSRNRQAEPIDPSARGEFLAESLLEQVGEGALERLIKILRESSPPETSRAKFDYSYNEVGLRQLAKACGPSGNRVVEEALHDESVPVRIAACCAAGALNGAAAASKLWEIDSIYLGDSALWPSGSSAVPDDAIISNLTQGPPDLRLAAAIACTRLDLPGTTKHLLPLLQKTPLLGEGPITLRETVMEVFRTLPTIPEAAQEEIKRCARADPSRTVRAKAIRALGTNCEKITPGVLVKRLGDAPEVSRAAASVLPERTEQLSPRSFQNLADRWILHAIGAQERSGSRSLVEDPSVPEALLEDVLYHRLLEENQLDPQAFRPAEEIGLEGLSASSEWFEMASWGLSIKNAWRGVFGEEKGGGSVSRSFEIIEAVFEELQDVAFADKQTQTARLTRGTVEEDLPQKVLTMCNRTPELGRRLAALTYYALGAPQSQGESSHLEAPHQPLHKRLRSVSRGPPPRERLKQIVERKLSGEGGAGGALGLYVLALRGDRRAEARLINRLVAGDFKNMALVWSLLAQTEPFSNRGDEFLESVISPYLTSPKVALAQRWAAFRDLFSWREIRAENTSIHDSTWQVFFSDCAGAKDLLPWADRHKAALQLAHRNSQYAPLRTLWGEKASSVKGISEEERYAYARDMLWADTKNLWAELWDRWPQEADVWGVRMLGTRGDLQSAQRIKTAVRKRGIPEREAQEAVEHIKRRTTS